MSESKQKNPITPDKFDAVLFDLDGVITDTASVHAKCWKKMFDEYLNKRSAEKGEPFHPFDIETDYRLYVDGKPRFNGVRDFLTSRKIILPEGTHQDPSNAETVGGLGNRKNDLINEVIENDGVEAYEGTITLARQIRDAGIKIAVVTSSQNCDVVLKAVNITDLFEAQVDGNVIHELHLSGKPAPDSFLEGAKRLGVQPARAVVVEDAISGVQAGRNGKFGLVIGVDRKGNAEELRKNGADIVVKGLEEFL